MTALQNRLALHRFICGEFGYEGLPAMLERLRTLATISYPLLDPICYA